MHGMQFRPVAPPVLVSDTYTDEFNEVKAIGALVSTNRTLAQTAAVQFWTDMPGTVTTVGRWNQIARYTAAQQTNSVSENARLFALLNIGLADAGITAWDSKYFYNRWRPITAIHEAATDGNGYTSADTNWVSMLTTPAFPAYVSAHSTFSAAAAGILTGFYGTDNLVFPVDEYMNPANKRFFTSFSGAAEEAGAERVWAGVHFASDNTRGLTAGRNVSTYLLQNLFQPFSCPPDTDGIDTDGDGNVSNDTVCVQLGAGDGFAKMADGTDLYTFSFSDANGLSQKETMERSMLHAETPAPTLVFKEGQKVYLRLTNVGMAMRPDLFDPHTVHWHGFANAASIFDGVPDASISINMGGTLTYFYNVVNPGTYMYHCHVEATEHMEMGMLGNLYVLPKQNNLPDGTNLKGFIHHTGYKYAYNDGDGSTYYDVGYPLQMSGFDRNFHEQHLGVQPLPFADLEEDYTMLNGRNYPDTVNTGMITNINGFVSQKINSLITAKRDQQILLRISSLSISEYNSITVAGIPMKVIGRGAHILRGPDPDGDGPLVGKDLYYQTSVISLGGGESTDVILDTTSVEPGTYFLYNTRLDKLRNDQQDIGGIMTEIVITP
jgi:FtsP/CotA-like multicopper oxidase with cupredoxin domain/membrane-associated phospholipid phosphatase